MDIRFPNTMDRNIQIRDVIHGSIEISEWEKYLVDTPFFQRLRYIRQLGFSELAYPCATHNRYTHSLGAMHLAGQAFQYIFRYHTFSSQEVYRNYYNLVRAAALLHDVGHGPLSHTTEFAMPLAKDLNIPAEIIGQNLFRQATHEDFTLKIILDSSLSPIITKYFAPMEITPRHIASILSMDLSEPDDFFIDKNVNYRKILHQIVSSEIDADRMDYLQRDSYYTGVSYGNFDVHWLLSNLTYHITSNENDPRDCATAHLALSHRAIYTFEDFLLSRYHMFLMVYYHQKSVVYEKILEEYLKSKDCSYSIPADIEAYVEYDDNHLAHHLRSRKDSPWARRISERRPYLLTYEKHSSANELADPSFSPRLQQLRNYLEQRKIHFMETNDHGLVSKYVGGGNYKKDDEIYVMTSDRLGPEQFVPLASVTELFRRYQKDKQIVRVYTPIKIDGDEIAVTV